MSDLPPDDSTPSKRTGRRLVWSVLALVAIVAAVIIVWMNAASQVPSYVPPADRPVRNAPFITSSDAVVEKMVELAELSADDVAYDLGCGDGRIIITAALKTGCQGIGYDINPELVAKARENVKLHGVEHLVQIKEQDIFTVDLQGADAVLFYLLPLMNKKLIPQIQQMRPGSRVISHDFGLGDIKDVPPEKTEYVELAEKEETHQIHRWTTPLKIPEPKQRR